MNKRRIISASFSPQHLQEEQETAGEITASGEFEEHLTFEDQEWGILQFLHTETGLEIWRDAMGEDEAVRAQEQAR
jgi:hypothetical protein